MSAVILTLSVAMRKDLCIVNSHASALRSALGDRPDLFGELMEQHTGMNANIPQPRVGFVKPA